jgi:hypothetical protein
MTLHVLIVGKALEDMTSHKKKLRDIPQQKAHITLPYSPLFLYF